MDIQRVNTYDDPRFSQVVLNQHGAFLVDGEPYEIEIISASEAIVRGAEQDRYADLIDVFRFYTPQITAFYNQNNDCVRQFPSMPLLKIDLSAIQPSQFYVDQDKLNAICSFIHKAEDIIIQVIKYGDRYISLDGHTRLFYAVMNGWEYVMAVEDGSGDYIYGFVEEAIRRGITTAYDLQLISHAEYEEKWNKFCDDYFGQKEENKT